jgi:hypothetical protein
MINRIETSADWADVSQQLRRVSREIGYNPDLNKLFKNVDNMVDELNRLEVEARRKKNRHITDSKVAEINQAIETLEGWLINLRLMS